MKRISVLLPYLMAAAVAFGLVLTGCEGEQGPPGTNPQAPPIITAVVAVPDSIGAGEYSTLVVNAYDPNGDPLTFQWSATAGTFSSPTQSVTNWTPPDSIAVYMVTVTVTDDDGSVNRTAMVGVNSHVPDVAPSYLGNSSYTCNVCHANKVADWMTTPHSTAFADSAFIGIEHRTTGYDTGIDNGGYDDNPCVGLRNVQCEACHGPLGPEMGVPHTYASAKAYTGESCGHCHAEYPEYEYSGHFTAMERAGGQEAYMDEWGGNSCVGCHVSEGFIRLWDTDWANRPVPALGHQVSCGTCHDPHSSSDENPEQLRTVADFNLPYNGDPVNPGSYAISGWGKGQLCGQCHHSRRAWSGSSSSISNQVANGNAHFGPHESPQADMLSGRGSYEIPGMTYDRGHGGVFPGDQHTDVCVSCHMANVSTPYSHSNHNFAAMAVSSCDICHQGEISSRQTEITGLMDNLLDLLPQDAEGNMLEPVDTLSYTFEQRQAAYAYVFVHADGSHGAHNVGYARSLLQNAIDLLTP